MKRLAILSALSLCGVLSGAASGQDAHERVHLDGFDVPQQPVARQSEIDQLDMSIAAASRAIPDQGRTVIVQNVSQKVEGSITQLSQSDEGAPPAQLSEAGQFRDTGLAAISDSSQSRPRGDNSVEGVDRCEQQPGQPLATQCAQILERRANEFAATEAPVMSPEQVLLAEHADEAGVLAQQSSDFRLALARGDPRAELLSNQELASISLAQGVNDGPRSVSAEEAPLDQMAEILEAIQIGINAGPLP